MKTAHKHSYAVDFHYLAQIERKSLKFLMKKLFSFVSGSVIANAISIFNIIISRSSSSSSTLLSLLSLL